MNDQERPNVVVSDAFDRVMFEGFKQTSKVIKDQTAKSVEADCITEDVFNSFFKATPQFSAEGPKLQKDLVEQMQKLPEYKDLRTETTLDDIASAMASAKLAPDLVNRLVEIQEKRQQQKQKGNGKGPIQQKDTNDGIPDDMKSEIRAQIRKDLKQAQDQIDQWNETALGWGITPGELQKMPIKEKLELVKNLLSTSKFRQIAELAGRLKNIANSSMATVPTHGNDEIVDITQGDNIARLLPTELIKLKKTPALFMKDLAERKLLQYNLRGEEPQGKGPIVVCVDISGSMAGQREVWAKAVMLALAHITDRQNRAFAVITFDTQCRHTQVYKSGKLTLKEKMDLAAMHMQGGGTAFMPPLNKAFQILSEYPEMKRSDVIFITDGECGVSEKDLTRIKDLKKATSARVLGIEVGSNGNVGETLEALSDDLVLIDDTGEIEHFRDIANKTLTKKVG